MEYGLKCHGLETMKLNLWHFNNIGSFAKLIKIYSINQKYKIQSNKPGVMGK